MQDVGITDHQNCRAWKWRTKDDDRAWNGGRKKYSFNTDNTTM